MFKSSYIEYYNILSIVSLSILGGYIVNIDVFSKPIELREFIVIIIKILSLVFSSIYFYFIAFELRKRYNRSESDYDLDNTIPVEELYEEKLKDSNVKKRFFYAISCLIIFFIAPVLVDYLTPHITQISVKTILIFLSSLSFYYIYRVVNFFHIAHAFSITFGAYLTCLFYITIGIPFVISILLSVTLGVALMLIINKLIYHPLSKTKVERWQMLVISLGLYIILQNILSYLTKDSVFSFRFWPVEEGHKFLGATITNVEIIILVIGVILVLGCSFLFNKTRLGKKIKAVSSNQELSELLGISTQKAIILSMIIGSALACCTGILIAADNGMTASKGFDWLLYGVVAMIIGGIGKIRHLFYGSLLLAVIQYFSSYFWSGEWINFSTYIILIFFLFYKPYGFSGDKILKKEV